MTSVYLIINKKNYPKVIKIEKSNITMRTSKYYISFTMDFDLYWNY